VVNVLARGTHLTGDLCRVFHTVHNVHEYQRLSAVHGLETAKREDVLKTVVDPVDGSHQPGKQMPVDGVLPAIPITDAGTSRTTTIISVHRTRAAVRFFDVNRSFVSNMVPIPASNDFTHNT